MRFLPKTGKCLNFLQPRSQGNIPTSILGQCICRFSFINTKIQKALGSRLDNIPLPLIVLLNPFKSPLGSRLNNVFIFGCLKDIISFYESFSGSKKAISIHSYYFKITSQLMQLKQDFIAFILISYL